MLKSVFGQQGCRALTFALARLPNTQYCQPFTVLWNGRGL